MTAGGARPWGVANSLTRRHLPALTRRRLQIALGILWLFDAILECQSDFFEPDFFGQMLTMNPSAPPAWLWDLITKVEPSVTAHAVAANTVAVVLQFTIALSLLWRPTVRLGLALSIPWAIIIWLFGEAAGGIFVDGANALTGAPGAALVYAVVAVLLWPRRSDEAPAAGDSGLLPRPSSAVLWAAMWVGTAALQGGKLDRSPNYMSQAMDNAAVKGPGWLHAAGTAVGGLVGSHGAVFAACTGIAQAAVGIGVVFPRTRRVALVAGVVLALFYAVVGQALGGVFSNGFLGIMSSGATDPGTGPIVVLLALAAWPRQRDTSQAEPHGDRETALAGVD